MKKREINVYEMAGQILTKLPKGILLTTQSGNKVNTMTIGWGTLGCEWAKPVFIAYIRKSRYTHRLLEENGEFTVNVPVGETDRRIINYCGTKSGDSTDKICALGLTTVPSDIVTPPGIMELPLTLECRVLYSQDQRNDFLPKNVLEQFYPEEKISGRMGRDFHTEYYGEIVKAYIIEE